jgi:hypothetical protein
MVCAVLIPLSFSSRFMRVTAAARPIDMAKMGSRLLSRWSILLYDMASRINELRYDVLVRHGCSGKVCCTGLEVVEKDKAA